MRVEDSETGAALPGMDGLSMRWISLASLIGVLVSSLADAAVPALECILTETHGPKKGAEYAIRSTGKMCEGREARKGEGEWKSISAESCDRISRLLRQNGGELQAIAETQKKPNHHYPKLKTPKARLGTLRCGSNQWNVTLDTSETCDVTMTHCESPKLDSASQLALELRTVLSDVYAK